MSFVREWYPNSAHTIAARRIDTGSAFQYGASLATPLLAVPVTSPPERLSTSAPSRSQAFCDRSPLLEQSSVEKCRPRSSALH